MHTGYNKYICVEYQSHHSGLSSSTNNWAGTSISRNGLRLSFIFVRFWGHPKQNPGKWTHGLKPIFLVVQSSTPTSMASPHWRGHVLEHEERSLQQAGCSEAALLWDEVNKAPRLPRSKTCLFAKPGEVFSCGRIRLSSCDRHVVLSYEGSFGVALA